jgi:hypothetical protein
MATLSASLSGKLIHDPTYKNLSFLSLVAKSGLKIGF